MILQISDQVKCSKNNIPFLKRSFILWVYLDFCLEIMNRLIDKIQFRLGYWLLLILTKCFWLSGKSLKY